MKQLSAILSATAMLCGAALFTPSAYAQPAAASATAVQLSSGEVVKVDKDTAKITIKHGPLANLDMPAMTMVFKVKTPSMLDQVKAGDKIGFIAEKVNGALTVTKLETAK